MHHSLFQHFNNELHQLVSQSFFTLSSPVLKLLLGWWPEMQPVSLGSKISHSDTFLTQPFSWVLVVKVAINVKVQICKRKALITAWWRPKYPLEGSKMWSYAYLFLTHSLPLHFQALPSYHLHVSHYHILNQLRKPSLFNNSLKIKSARQCLG